MGGPRAARVVVASDAFKGSLTSLEVGDAVRLGVWDVAPHAEVVVVPVADGGEGTVAAALASGWAGVAAQVHGPTGEPVTATLAVRGSSVLVEMADACGLGRLPDAVPAPLTASSRGLGDAIRAALDLGATEVVVGVGGSASTDGGGGMLSALGARLLDVDGVDLADGGVALAGLARLDLSGLDPRLARTRLILAADVDSPLLGPAGAGAVFAPQKGATPAEVAVLEAALTHWATVVASTPGADSTNRSHLPRTDDPGPGADVTYWSDLPHPDDVPTSTNRSPQGQPAGVPKSTYWSMWGRMPGAGAAGGVGFALLAVLGAERASGVDVVLDLVGLDAALTGAHPVGTHALTGDSPVGIDALTGASPVGVASLARADLVVTGEGSLDAQTLAGKAVRGVARRAAAHGIPVVAVCGRLALDDADLSTLGVSAAYPLSDLEPDPRRSIEDAAALLRRIGSIIATSQLPPAL